MKKIIFFDADGTLWYPKKTRNSSNPGWIYENPKIMQPYLHLILTPTTMATLRRLKKTGVRCVIISATPYPLHSAKANLEKKLRHLHLHRIIDGYYLVNMRDGAGKAKRIIRTLKDLGIKKSEALMIGDSYWADYKYPRANGIDALLFNSEFQNSRAWQVRKAKYKIYKMSDILRYI